MMDKTTEAVKAITALIASLEKIYADEEMAQWGSANKVRCRMERRIRTQYSYLDKLIESITISDKGKNK